MIVEITTHEDKTCRLVASEVVGFEEFTLYAEEPPADKVPAVQVLLRGDVTRIAKYDTLSTFTERLTAARGGTPLHVHALDPRNRPAPKPQAPTSQPQQSAPAASPPNGQIIVPGANAPAAASELAPTAPTTAPTEPSKPAAERKPSSRHK